MVTKKSHRVNFKASSDVFGRHENVRLPEACVTLSLHAKLNQIPQGSR